MLPLLALAILGKMTQIEIILIVMVSEAGRHFRGMNPTIILLTKYANVIRMTVALEACFNS
jgi:hypothetical protein